MTTTSMTLLLRKKPGWRVSFRISGGEHISCPGCMGEPQALLAASLIETKREKEIFLQ